MSASATGHLPASAASHLPVSAVGYLPAPAACSLPASCILLDHLPIFAACHLPASVNSIKVEDNRRVYESEDAFLRLPTSFGKSVRYGVLSIICVLDRKLSELSIGRGKYVIVLLA